MMEFQDKTIRYPRNLWVQTGGVKLTESGEHRVAEGIDAESYVKVLNHFGRVLKLYTFEDGRWVDADTGATPGGFDDHLAGYVSEAPPIAGEPPAATGKPERKRAAAGSARKAGGKASAKSTSKSTAGKTPSKAGTKAGTKTSSAKSGGKRAGSAGGSPGRGRGASRTRSRPAAK